MSDSYSIGYELLLEHCYSLYKQRESTVRVKLINVEDGDGAKRTRTADPLNAIEVLYQLSYNPLLPSIAH